ncbi:MAG: hypothetical protein JRN20_00690 [Nitrososphaerota archaeon]|nr:hypothetical protein [Nitrososphaerota archaeon]MDG6921773.1 hypothetical protein [Nitrososphaerota archaeon]
MPINLKKLQAYARRKLQITSPVEWDSVSKGRTSQMESSYLSARFNGKSHIISYSNVSSLNQTDVFHALCIAKLNEMGFTTIEAAALDSIRICTKDDPKFIVDANSAETIVVETYANSLLFFHFPDESKVQRERMILRFESSDALTTLHTQMGFWGTAGVSYHRAASNNSNIPFPNDLIEKAMQRASDGVEIKKEYDAINLLLEELPKIDVQVERLTPEDSIRIVDLMVRLFSAKTGLECA